MLTKFYKIQKSYFIKMFAIIRRHLLHGHEDAPPTTRPNYQRSPHLRLMERIRKQSAPSFF
ncbi:MAG: hypothetical protein NEHIOOID_00707 [Holosporales bacterium]